MEGKNKIVIYKKFRDFKGNNFVLALNKDTNDTTNALIATQNPKTKVWEWREAGLKDLALGLRFKIGTSIVWDLLGDTSVYTNERNKFNKILPAEFNSFTVSFGWNYVQPKSPSQFDYQMLDWQISQLRRKGFLDNLYLRGQALVSGNYPPDWLKNGNFSRDQMIQLLRSYVSNTVSRYKGKINEWVVVNEPAGNTGSWTRDDIFYKIIGPDYIDIAFQAAREADPSAVLIFNDTDNHTPSGHTTQNTKQIVARLKQKGLIDGVGVQMHLLQFDNVIPQKDELVATLQSYGVPVYITELDVNLSNITGTQEQRFKKQAEIYKTAIEAFIDSGVGASFTMWETTGDRFNWLENYLHYPDANGTIFDDDLNPKPAYYAVRDVLMQYAQK